MAGGDSLNTIAKEVPHDGAEHRVLEPGDLPDARPGGGPATGRTCVQVGWTLAVIPDTVIDEQELPDADARADGPVARRERGTELTRAARGPRPLRAGRPR